MKNLFKNRTSRLNALLAVLIVTAMAITVLINVLAAALSDKYILSADLTANAAYNIGDDTKEILENLTDDIEIYVLSDKSGFSGSTYLTQMRTILEKYPKYSPHISLEYIDYTTDPSFAANYPELTLSAGDVIVSGPYAVKQLPLANMFTYTYDENNSVVVSGSRVEEAVTSAIVGAVTNDPVYVGILTGNAVSEDRSTLETTLANNNYMVGEVDMVTGSLNEYDVLFLLAPAQDLSEDVLSKFDEFLYNNGEYGKTLIYAASAEQSELPNLNVFLRDWGMSVDDGMVFETNESYAYGYQPYYPFTDYADDTFKDLLKDSSEKVLMPVSKPISIVFDYKDNKTVTELLSFSSTAGVRPSDAGSNFTTDQATSWGPMPALLMSTMMTSSSDNYSNVILSSSAYALSSSILSNSSIANAQYWIAILNTITDRQGAVSIESKSLEGNELAITTSAARTWNVILCVVIPVLVLLTGIFVYLRRRYR